MEKETDKQMNGSKDPDNGIEKLKKLLAKIKKSAKASKEDKKKKEKKLMIG
jgi:hypothetical protein